MPKVMKPKEAKLKVKELKAKKVLKAHQLKKI
jgi:hypothetical protein